MPDQASHLRQLVRASVHADATLAPGGPVITLTGAQSNVGATTAACGLARELARLGKQVILIDANLNRPAVATMLRPELADHPSSPNNFPTSPDQAWSGLRGTLADILTGARRAVEVLAATSDDGLRFIAGPPVACGLAPPLGLEAADRFTAELAALTRQADVVVLDAGRGMNAWIDRLWQLSCEVLLVATPTAQSLLDAYAAAKLSQYERHDNKLRLLVNRTRDELEARPLGHRFAETCQRFLNIRPKPPASLPAFDRRPSESTSPERQQGREHYQRSLRLLAADLTAEIRVASLRLIRPTLPASQHDHSLTSRGLTQRR
jgi:MinD-like ATPase involved in chromosome partitioning or flagellar assembly